MRSVTATEANRDFSKLLREVAAGETVVVTSHGRAVAKMVPAQEEGAEDVGRRRESWNRLMEYLRAQPPRNLGRFDRGSLYDDDA